LVYSSGCVVGLSKVLSERLDAQAEDIVDAWLASLTERQPAGSPQMFPAVALRRRFPELLRAIARHIEQGEPFDKPDVRQELRQIALLRRSQGYGPEELVAEFELLSDQVFGWLREQFEDIEAEHPREVMGPIDRLRYLLGRLGSVTVWLYRTEMNSHQLEREEILTEFGRSVTHELRNRLSSASLAVHLLEQALSGTDHGSLVRELLDKLGRSLQRAEHVVSDVVAVSLARKPRDPSLAVYEPLSTVLEGVLDDLEGLAREREVMLSHTDIYDVLVDVSYTRLVLVNLVSNAVKYSDPRKDERWVRIGSRLDASKQWVRIEVADNGVGIDETMQPVVFDRLVRASKDPEVDGEGIGLHTANQAARRLGGRLELSSVEGEGSVFTFRVPVPGA